MKKRIVCLTLAILMCGSQAVSVMADRESDLREEQAWTSQQLDATYARMSALWDQKQQLESQIESLNSDLVNVMVSIQTLESDIASKEAEIEKTQGDLTKAQNAKDKQYGAMKKRIQYLYEKGGNNAWFQMMLNADNLADLLTRAEYTQQMYEQDRESLQKYARTIEEVQKLEDQYEQEKADFETMKEEYEAQQSNLQYQLDVTRANSADCENEIAYAQQQATEYANLLEQQQAEIEQLEAERIAAEEEARRQAEAEAAAAAAAQEAAQNGDNSSEEVQYDEDGNVVSGSSDGSSDYEYDDTRVDEYANIRKMNWTNKGEWPHPGQAVMKTLTDITAYTDYVDTLNSIFTDEEEEDAEETEKDYPIYSEIEFLEEVYMSRDEYERMVGILKTKKNIIICSEWLRESLSRTL